MFYLNPNQLMQTINIFSSTQHIDIQVQRNEDTHLFFLKIQIFSRSRD